MQVSCLPFLLFRGINILEKVVLITFFIWIIITVAVTEFSLVIYILILQLAVVNFYELGILWCFINLNLYYKQWLCKYGQGMKMGHTFEILSLINSTFCVSFIPLRSVCYLLRVSSPPRLLISSGESIN